MQIGPQNNLALVAVVFLLMFFFSIMLLYGIKKIYFNYDAVD